MGRIKKENTLEEIDRGKALGLWIRTGLAQKKMKVSELARTIDRSRSYINDLANKDGIGSRGGYNRASEAIIDEIADALGIDANDGRRAAGYGPATPRRPVMHRFTIGELGGTPVEVTLPKALSEEELKQLRLATRLILGDEIAQ